MVGFCPVVETLGISCRTATKRKYTFARFWNCSHRFLGTKFHLGNQDAALDKGS